MNNKGIDLGDGAAGRVLALVFALTLASGFFIPRISFEPEGLMDGFEVSSKVFQPSTAFFVLFLALSFALTVHYSRTKTLAVPVAALAGALFGSLGFYFVFGLEFEFFLLGAATAASLGIASIKASRLPERNSFEGSQKAVFFAWKAFAVLVFLILVQKVHPLQGEYFSQGLTWFVENSLASNEDQAQVIGDAFMAMAAACPSKTYTEEQVFALVRNTPAYRELDSIPDREQREIFQRIFVETTTQCLNQKAADVAASDVKLPPREEVVGKVYLQLLEKSPMMKALSETFGLAFPLLASLSLLTVGKLLVAPLAGLLVFALARLLKP